MSRAALDDFSFIGSCLTGMKRVGWGSSCPWSIAANDRFQAAVEFMFALNLYAGRSDSVQSSI